MEPKKSKKADLEKNISTYFSIGLIIALSLSLIAFEWASTPGSSSLIDIGTGTEFIDEIEEKSYEKKEDIKLPEIPADVFIVRDDNIDLPTDVFFPDDDIRENDDIKPYIPKIEDEPDYDEPIIIIAGEMPRFRDGDLNSFVSWAQKKLVYPSIAAENGVGGKVYLHFVVEKDGSLSNVELLKGRDPALDSEALRVIKLSPKWSPGTNNGIPVRVRCSIMINFVLQN